MRNLKVLGIAMAAIFAMSAVAASMATAEELTLESSPSALAGSQIAEFNNILNVAGSGAIKCKTANYSAASVSSGVTTVSVTPTYSGCEALGFAGSEIHMNGCTYLLHLASGENTTVTADIVCPAGAEITVTAISVGTTKCTIHIPPQTNLPHIIVTNIGSGATRELELHLTVGPISTSETPGTGLGKCAAATGAGELIGTVKVTASKGGVHDGIFLS